MPNFSINSSCSGEGRLASKFSIINVFQKDRRRVSASARGLTQGKNAIRNSIPGGVRLETAGSRLDLNGGLREFAGRHLVVEVAIDAVCHSLSRKGLRQEREGDAWPQARFSLRCQFMRFGFSRWCRTKIAGIISHVAQNPAARAEILHAHGG